MRVVLADDSVLLREGMASLLSSNSFEVVSQVDSAESLLDAVASHHPDVAIVDIRMPPSFTDEGIRAAESLAERHPATAVLVLSHHVEATFVLRLLEQETRGRGYLLKDHVGDVETFLGAVRTVADGGSFVDPDVVRRLLARDADGSSLRALTERELEVLALMAEGRTNRAIGEALLLGAKTVETHVRNVFMKLGLGPDVDGDRRVMAVLRYLRAH
jgi:serine/threonine-protein kinase